MTTMIKLTGINKIYRTEEIETQALENVNLEVKKGEFDLHREGGHSEFRILMVP